MRCDRCGGPSVTDGICGPCQLDAALVNEAEAKAKARSESYLDAELVR